MKFRKVNLLIQDHTARHLNKLAFQPTSIGLPSSKGQVQHVFCSPLAGSLSTSLFFLFFILRQLLKYISVERGRWNMVAWRPTQCLPPVSWVFREGNWIWGLWSLPRCSQPRSSCWVRSIMGYVVLTRLWLDTFLFLLLLFLLFSC